jgi:hypothetical protein
MTDATNFSTPTHSGPPVAGQHLGHRNCECGKVFSAVLALTLIGLGTLLLLDKFQIIDMDQLLVYWPAIVIAAGASMLVRGRRHLRAGVVMVTIGGVLLAESTGLLQIRLVDLWPLLLILVGIFVVLSSLRARRERSGGRGEIQ